MNLEKEKETSWLVGWRVRWMGRSDGPRKRGGREGVGELAGWRWVLASSSFKVCNN